MLARLWFALVLALVGPACGGSQVQSESQVLRYTASIQLYLVAGAWRLADYRPGLALEPMLQAMLAQQVSTMVVHFDGHSLTAASPTVQITRSYTLENVVGFEFDLVSPDAQGGGYLRSRCQLSGDGRRIVFSALTDPWVGIGTLERQ
jgi:hypothetical protein